MAFVGNVLWFILGGGFLAWLAWMLAGILFTITIIGIPFAVAAFRVAPFAAFPFGRELVDAELVGERRAVGAGIVNVLWVILIGLWLALFHIIYGLACFVSIIGIPFGLAHFKLAKVCFAPMGKRIVSSDIANATRMRQANAYLDEKLGKR